MNMIYLLLLLFILIFKSCNSEPEMITIDIHKANRLICNGDYRYLDVRTSEEFMKGHVDFDDALSVPYMFDTHQGRVKNSNFLEQVLSLCKKDDHLVVTSRMKLLVGLILLIIYL
ncbi:putative Rhodanese-like domain superfamily protein [Helianthus anomalus]